MNNNWKERLGVVYSTNPHFQYQKGEKEVKFTLPPQQQNLTVQVDKKQRRGKWVTLVAGFVGSDNDLKGLGKLLKTSCGVGGTVKNGKILIQGNFCDKVIEILHKEGYKAQRAGG